MKRRPNSPFIRRVMVKYAEEPDDLFDLIRELGFEIFEDPSTNDCSDAFYFVSNRKLTYRWLLKNAKRYGINEKWLKRNFSDELDNNTSLDEK